ncbi:hypothetical protein BDZ45DRAFT_754806 [Acephala macrosclerotiorum]|nr:hypothetical protein BDZ45DRAFT_754806 [Acephala macrosclerotiorum]
MSTPTPTSTFFTSTSPATTAAASQITDPAFYGYTSLSILENESTLFSSVDCNAGSTFTVVSGYLVDHANCCAGECGVFTSCPVSTTLDAAGTTQTCTGSSTCVIDTIYGAAATHAIYCGVGEGGQWYRSLPENGITLANTSAIDAANRTTASSMATWKIITIAVNVFIFLVIFGVLLLCCCGCNGALESGPDNNGTRMLTARERRRERRRQQKEREKERQDEIERGIQETKKDEARIANERGLQG